MSTPAWYAEYLQTEHWRFVRALALYWAGHRCQVCNASDRLEGHHRTYERLGCERPSDITILCETCHGLFHDRIPAPPARDPRDGPEIIELRRPRRTADHDNA